MMKTLIRGVAACSLLLTLAGCYETDFPVIEAGKGDEIPNLAGTYDGMQEGEELVVEDKSGNPASNGYAYLVGDGNGNGRKLLASKLQENLWLVQVDQTEDGGPERYSFWYLDGSGGNFVFKYADVMGPTDPTVLNKDGPAAKMASEMGVTLTQENAGDDEPRLVLNGSREDILAFLRAHPGKVELMEFIPLVRK